MKLAVLRDSPKRFHLLDVLRGLASLAVIVWHYQHFFYVAPGTLPPDFDRAVQPFYAVLGPLYEAGAQAVQLFFVLSGFVFYFHYGAAIRERSISPYEFVLLRLSRLYPLYFATLVYVAALQLQARSWFGSFIVYPMNDLRHFLLNLFFASDWGLERGFSFNSPTWSVSIEILLYAIFFLVMLAVGKTLLGALVSMLIGIWFALHVQADLGWGLYCFFAGGIALMAFERAAPRFGVRWPLRLAALTFVGAAATLLLLPAGAAVAHRLIAFGACFPALVLLLALLQLRIPEAGRSLRGVGDITYATYLLHFPIQLTVILAATRLGIAVDYTRPIWFLLFLGVVIAVSIPTYHWFELPAQSFLRRRFISARPPQSLARA